MSFDENSFIVQEGIQKLNFQVDYVEAIIALLRLCVIKFSLCSLFLILKRKHSGFYISNKLLTREAFDNFNLRQPS